MITEIIKVNQKKPKKNIIKKAAKIIKKGGLVAFPTETVYGLGANALNKIAVRKIFKVKGRPFDNPMIVHIADFSDLFKLTKNVPQKAKLLIKKFWPGPLTIVLFKTKMVPDEVTAGSKTVAIRMPKNKIALELIKASNVPIAAPSANLATRPSPTTAQHVFEDLKDKIDLILDGGKTKVGVESTVVDLTTKPPLILRPGGISLEKIKKVLKDIKLHSLRPFGAGKIIKSPGMKYRHYAPKAPLILIEGKEQISKIQNLIDYYKKQKKIVGVMTTQENKHFYKNANLVLVVGSRKNLKEIAQNLFKTLREFDKKKVDPAPFRKKARVKKKVSSKRCGVDVILAEGFPEKEIGFAIMHRLRKAALS